VGGSLGIGAPRGVWEYAAGLVFSVAANSPDQFIRHKAQHRNILPCSAAVIRRAA
jgi:hypothetical protein